MSDSAATVLVVEPQADVRDHLSELAETAGFDVLTCPGPTGPDYSCVGARGPGCPLVSYADLVLLDLSLDSELALEGATAVELITYYLAEGKKIVALSRNGAQEIRAFKGEDISFLRWPSEGKVLVAKLRETLRSA